MYSNNIYVFLFFREGKSSNQNSNTPAPSAAAPRNFNGTNRSETVSHLLKFSHRGYGKSGQYRKTILKPHALKNSSSKSFDNSTKGATSIKKCRESLDKSASARLTESRCQACRDTHVNLPSTKTATRFARSKISGDGDQNLAKFGGCQTTLRKPRNPINRIPIRTAPIVV